MKTIKFKHQKKHLMKEHNLIRAMLMVIILLPLCHCTEGSKKGNYLPELRIEIPDAIKDNTEAVLFIENSQMIINQWSNTFEDLVIAGEPYVSKTEEELSAVDKLKLGKIMMDFMSGMGKFAVEIADIEQTLTTIEDGMTEKESNAMETVMTSFNKRISEIGKKYENFGNEEPQNASFN